MQHPTPPTKFRMDEWQTEKKKGSANSEVRAAANISIEKIVTDSYLKSNKSVLFRPLL